MPPAEDQEAVRPIIYRKGTPNPGNLKPRPVDEGLVSFWDSMDDPNAFPVGEDYFGVDVSQLPQECVIYDNDPPGHVSLTDLSPEQIKKAVVRRGKVPPREVI